MTEATKQYLRDMSPAALRKAIYNSERAVIEARKHLPDLRAQHMVACNEVFVPVAREIAEARGISLRPSALA